MIKSTDKGNSNIYVYFLQHVDTENIAVLMSNAGKKFTISMRTFAFQNYHSRKNEMCSMEKGNLWKRTPKLTFILLIHHDISVLIKYFLE